MAPPRRTEATADRIVAIRVTEAEREQLLAAARAEQLTTSDHVRRRLGLALAHVPIGAPPSPGSPSPAVPSGTLRAALPAAPTGGQDAGRVEGTPQDPGALATPSRGGGVGAARRPRLDVRGSTGPELDVGAGEASPAIPASGVPHAAVEPAAPAPRPEADAAPLAGDSPSPSPAPTSSSGSTWTPSSPLVALVAGIVARSGAAGAPVAQVVLELLPAGEAVASVHAALAELAAAGRLELQVGADETGLCPPAPGGGGALVLARALDT